MGRGSTVCINLVPKSPKPYLAAACGNLKNQIDVQRVSSQQEAPKHDQNNRACEQRQLKFRNHQNQPQLRCVRLITPPHQPSKNEIPVSRLSNLAPPIVQPSYYIKKTAKICPSPTENISRFDLQSGPSSSDETKLKRTFQIWRENDSDSSNLSANHRFIQQFDY